LRGVLRIVLGRIGDHIATHSMAFAQITAKRIRGVLMFHEGYDPPPLSPRHTSPPCLPSESQGCVQPPAKRKWATPIVITSMDAGGGSAKTSTALEESHGPGTTMVFNKNS